jgi:hypothetical protein
MSHQNDPGSNPGDLVLIIIFILIMTDVWYKTVNPDCSPDAPWFLQATTRECQAIAAAKAMQERREEMAARREEAQSS